MSANKVKMNQLQDKGRTLVTKHSDLETIGTRLNEQIEIMKVSLKVNSIYQTL